MDRNSLINMIRRYGIMAEKRIDPESGKTTYTGRIQICAFVIAKKEGMLGKIMKLKPEIIRLIEERNAVMAS